MRSRRFRSKTLRLSVAQLFLMQAVHERCMPLMIDRTSAGKRRSIGTLIQLEPRNARRWVLTESLYDFY
jgi:hypothetical protein